MYYMNIYLELDKSKKFIIYLIFFIYRQIDRSNMRICTFLNPPGADIQTRSLKVNRTHL